MFSVRVLTVSGRSTAQRPVLRGRRRCHAPRGPRTLTGPRRIWRDPDVSSRFRRQLRVGPPTWPRYLVSVILLELPKEAGCRRKLVIAGLILWRHQSAEVGGRFAAEG